MCRYNRITTTKRKCNMYICITEKKTKKIIDYIKGNTYDKISEKINTYNPIKNKITKIKNNNDMTFAQIDENEHNNNSDTNENNTYGEVINNDDNIDHSMAILNHEKIFKVHDS